MNKNWNLQLKQTVVLNEKIKDGYSSQIGKLATIEEFMVNGIYDYLVKTVDKEILKVNENELNKIDKEHLQLYWEVQNDLVEVLHIPTNEKVKVVQVDLLHKQVEIIHEDASMQVVDIGSVRKIESEGDIMGEKENTKLGIFGEIGLEIGNFTDKKNKQYGSSVDATYEMIKVLMERYTYDEGNYLMPKSLLKHILLQVRMMDKQNRIFNNPSGEGDSESPYKDLAGYSLIGVEMVESGS